MPSSQTVLISSQAAAGDSRVWSVAASIFSKSIAHSSFFLQYSISSEKKEAENKDGRDFGLAEEDRAKRHFLSQ